MTLYEINELIENVLANCYDPETGEIYDEELMVQYDSLQMEKAEKVENIICFIKNLTADANAIREEEKALASRRQSALKKAEHLQSYLQFCLQGEKFSSPKGAVSYRKSQKVEVDENRLSEIPAEYLRYKDPEVNKTEVSKALKAGKEVPGCTLVDNVSMIIK